MTTFDGFKVRGLEPNNGDPVASEDPENTVDENEIIARVLKGETNDFRHLVLRYQSMVFSIVMRQVADTATAEELSQEIFVRAFTSLKDFRGESRFSTWLTRIAINHTSSYFSSKKFKQRKVTESFDSETHVMADRRLEEEHEQKEFVAQFRSALQELRPKFREVIVLCGLEGKSYEEVAGILDIPIGSVRSRLNKARLTLKEAMKRISQKGAAHES